MRVGQEKRSCFAQRHRGAAIVETMIALPVLAMMIMGSWQGALLYEAKTILNYAVLQGARAGAVNQADTGSIRLGLARGLLPLYAPDSSVNGVVRTLGTIEADLAANGEIKILNPTREAFDDFGVTPPNQNQKEIPNDRLDIRPTTVGAHSGVNIQDANLLKVRVRYGYELKIPIVRWVFSTALNVANWVSGGADAFETAMLAQNRLPVISTVTVRMQSPARLNNSMLAKGDIPDVPRVAANSNGASGSGGSSSSGDSGSSSSADDTGSGSGSSSAESSADSSDASSSDASSSESSDDPVNGTGNGDSNDDSPACGGPG